MINVASSQSTTCTPINTNAARATRPFAPLPFDVIAHVTSYLAPADVLALAQTNRTMRQAIREPSLLRTVLVKPAATQPRPWESPSADPLWEQLLMQALWPKRLRDGPIELGCEPLEALTNLSTGDSGRHMAVALQDGGVRLVNLFDGSSHRLANVTHDGLSELSLFEQEDLLLVNLDSKGQALWSLNDLSSPLWNTTQSDYDYNQTLPTLSLANHGQHLLVQSTGAPYSLALFSTAALKGGQRNAIMTWSNLSYHVAATHGTALLLVGALRNDAIPAPSEPQSSTRLQQVPAHTMEHWRIDTLTRLQHEPSPTFIRPARPRLETHGYPPQLRISPNGARVVFGPVARAMHTWSLSDPSWRAQVFSANLGFSAWHQFSTDGRYFALGSEPRFNDFLIYDFAAIEKGIGAIVPAVHPTSMIHFAADNETLYVDFDAFDLRSVRLPDESLPALARTLNHEVVGLSVERIVPFDREANKGAAQVATRWTTLRNVEHQEQVYMPQIAPNDAWAAFASNNKIVFFKLSSAR